LVPDLQSDADGGRIFIDERAGPIARAMRVDNSGVDRSRALQCLAAAVYYEARSESDVGQRAVAQVVLNRVAHPSYPNTVCGVVYQGSERTTGCQFSFTCDGSLAKA
ncbi:MAG: cell wall hydrolase, partial [Novosphingobium sp.]